MKIPRLSAAANLLMLLCCLQVRADTTQTVPTVARGSMYFQTQLGTSFNFGPGIGAVNFIGLPIGPGLTDTIVQRNAGATINGVAIPIQITALSLVSTAPVNVGGSFFDVFVTLDPAHLADDIGTATGSGTLSGGTFSTSFTESLDVHFAPHGGGTGFDVFLSQVLSNSSASWSPTPPPGAVLVPGPDDGSSADQRANLHSGLDSLEVDFFPLGALQECGPNGCHVVATAPAQQFKCPLTQGFWKNHPLAWPVTSLTLGGQTYTQAELLTILATPVASGGSADASLILADQLIAAKLNMANGSAPISATVAAADALLSGFTGKLPYGVTPSSVTGQAMVNDANTLNNYNSGQLTPSCVP
jgi:hypothetical protein